MTRAKMRGACGIAQVAVSILLIAASVCRDVRAQAQLVDDPAAQKRACVKDHEQAQLLRREAKLLASRESLRLCAQESCPPLVRADCLEMLQSLEPSLPSVVIVAKLGPQDVADVTVTIDGGLVRTRLDGTAIELDPGLHSIRLERAPWDPVEQQVLLTEGQKNRPLLVTFGNPEPSVSAPALAPTPESHEYRPIPRLDYVLAGVAAAGVASFIGFAVRAKNERDALEGSCAPVCSDAEVEWVRTRLIVADASLAVAVLSIAAGAYVYFTRPARARPQSLSSSPGNVSAFRSVSGGSGVWRLQARF